MSNRERKPTLVSQITERVQNNRFLAGVLIVGIGVIAFAKFTNAVRDIRSAWTWKSSIASAQNATPSANPSALSKNNGVPKPAGAPIATQNAIQSQRADDAITKQITSISQTLGFTFIAGSPAAGTYAESINLRIKNPLDENVDVTQLVISWERISDTSELIASTGIPKGADLIDRFSIRIASGHDENGEERGTCLWVYAKEDGAGERSEQIALTSQDNASFLPSKRLLSLKPQEEVTGEIVLKRNGTFRVTVAGVFRTSAFERSFATAVDLAKQ